MKQKNGASMNLIRLSGTQSLLLRLLCTSPSSWVDTLCQTSYQHLATQFNSWHTSLARSYRAKPTCRRRPLRISDERNGVRPWPAEREELRRRPREENVDILADAEAPTLFFAVDRKEKYVRACFCLCRSHASMLLVSFEIFVSQLFFFFSKLIGEVTLGSSSHRQSQTTLFVHLLCTWHIKGLLNT